MKRFAVAVILMAAVSAMAQSIRPGLVTKPDLVASGSWQWTVRGYATLPEAAAVLSSAAGDPLHPVLVDTSDPIVLTFGSSTPWVVFRWEHVDLWCCTPEHFTYVLPASKPAADAALDTYCSRLASGRRCGIVGSAASPFSGGSWVVWKTEP